MDISFVSNLADWKKGLDDVYLRQIPYAEAQALNDTVENIRDYHRMILPVVFDRPTRYTLNSLRVMKVDTRFGGLRAGIYFKESNRSGRHYLEPQVKGGARPHKRFEYWLINRGIMRSNEYAVPASGLKVDAFGNVPKGVITMVLSQLAAGPDAFQWETPRSKARAGASRSRYFVPPPGSSLRRGIWRRKGKKAIEPVFIFVSGVTYKARYQFFEISRDRAEAYFPAHFEEWMQKGIADERAYQASKGRMLPLSGWSMPR